MQSRLADVFIPGMSGIEVANQICRMVPQCRVVLFSAQANMVHVPGEIRIGGHDVLILKKPIAPDELLARLWAALRS